MTNVGYKLYRQIRDLAPQNWTSGELVVAWVIADAANEDTRRATRLTPPELARRSHMSERGARKALERLAERGFEFRVSLGKGSDGREIYALKGRPAEYQVPDIFMHLQKASAVAYGLVDATPEGGTTVPPLAGLSTDRRRYHSTVSAVPQYRLQAHAPF